MGEWITDTVINLQSRGILRVEDGNHGEYRPRPNEFVDTGVAFIRAADMDNGMVLFDSASKISEAARDRITKGIGKPGDILISHKGTVGKIARAPLDAPEFVCSPQTTFWRSTNAEVLIQDFLYVYMRSPAFLRDFLVRSGETDMAGYVSLTSQRCLNLTIPPIELQRPISSLISTLDDKIELNRRMNETLEATAQAVFKDWFVDFGPTRAKMMGREPYLAPEIWSTFPDSLGNDNQPRGWFTSTIGQEVDVVGGSTPSTKNSEFWGGEIGWATPKDLASISTPVLLSTERRITESGLSQISSGLLPVGTVLLSSRAPVGYLAIAQIPVAVNQGFIAMICRKRLSNAFVWLWAQANMETVHQNANGSTFQEISKANFRPIRVTVPSSDILRAFDDVAEPLLARIVSNEKESRSLAATRDFLLPKLMSGEVRVRDAEKIVGEAT
ncbi:MAG: restriction endonuclease subunit S [Pseudomonadota bacterium]